MKDYAIMHLERHAATIRGDGACTVYYPQFMPYNLYLEKADDLSGRMNNLNNFHYWCATRLITMDRKYAKEILNSLGMKQAVTDRERAEIAISYHALGLTDVFWVRELREEVRYAEINLYEHSLSDAFVDVSLRGRALTAQNAELIRERDSAGDLSTSGVAPKAWIRRNGKFILLKDGDPADVEAELVASRIARCFDVDQVLYEPREYEDLPVTSSRLMTSRAESIVPPEYVEIYAANHGKTLQEIVRKQDLYGFHMMNIVDYLVGNTDRHCGNWGFRANNTDNRLGKLHPLMDFNRAFRSYDTIEGARCLTMPGNVSQMEAALQGVRAVGLNQKEKLPEDLPALFRKLNGLTGMELEQMFAKRLEVLKKAE